MNGLFATIAAAAATFGLVALSTRAKGKEITKRMKFKDVSNTWDNVTDDRINTLHPAIQADARAAINELERQGVKVRVTSAYRSPEEQARLYSLGRSRGGNVVTNARAGQSYHNYGLALDVVEIRDGRPIWQKEAFIPIARVFKKYGFKWGGDFNSFKDYPHFEKTYGYNWRQLQTKMNGNNGKFPLLKV
jgi:peptidoglycan L-alanyl-D-glutamate endopeptidase CwlK